jgi:hypothetical protein
MMALLLRSTSPQLAYSVVSLAGGNSVAFGLKRSSVLRVHGLCIASSLLQRQPLTVTEMVTFAYHRSRRDLSRGYFESGTRAVPARGVTIRVRAAPGIIHAGTMAGAGGAFPGLGQVKAGNARRIQVPGSMAWS